MGINVAEKNDYPVHIFEMLYNYVFKYIKHNRNLSIYLHLYIHLSIYLYIHPHIYLSIHIYFLPWIPTNIKETYITNYTNKL